MIKLIAMIMLLTITTACQKEEITLLNESSAALVEDSPQETNTVAITFNNVFQADITEIFIFEEDELLQIMEIGCDNIFNAQLDIRYTFKKLSNQELIPLFGTDTEINTYFTFLTTEINDPQPCIDFNVEGLSVMTMVTNGECPDAAYTFNAWF